MPAIILLLLILVSPQASADKLRIFTAIPPLQTLLAQIGAERVTVSSLVPEGFDPHLFEPGPRQIGKLAEADLYISIGMPFESVLQPRLKQINPDMRYLDASDYISRQDHAANANAQIASHEQHLHYGIDPHIWTNPILIARLIPVIVETLVNVDSSNAVIYQKNGRQVVSDLQQLDRAISDILQPVRGQSFLVVHPAWGHFAERYQLGQLSLEFQGKRNSAKHQVALLTEAKAEGLNTVFVQNSSEIRSARPLAAALNGRVVMINPLAADYAGNMLAVAKSIRDSLQP